MPVYRILKNQAFDPELIRSMCTALDGALGDLGLVNLADPAVQAVAKRIIQLAQIGVQDPVRLRERAVQSFHTLGAA